MSFSLSRALAPARTRFAGATVTGPRILASSSTRLYSSTKNVFNPRDIHNLNLNHNPDHIQSKLPSKKQLRNANRFREFDLEGRVFAITGGGRGLGLSMAEALIEAGAKGMHFQQILRNSRMRANIQQSTASTVSKHHTQTSSRPKTKPKTSTAVAWNISELTSATTQK